MMKDFLFADHLLLRMPANSWNTYDDDAQTHLNNLYLRAAIYIASPLFFSCLEQNKFIYADLSEKEKLTFKKYINRFCFRPTPFGLFAGVSLIKWNSQTQLDIHAIRWEDIIILPDQAYVLKLSKGLLDDELDAEGLYEPNPTLYRLLEELRFISTESDDEDHSRKYLLQSIEYSSVLKDLASYCTVPQRREKIVTEISRLANCTVAISEDYFQFLTAEQFLVQRYRLNINGPDYLELLLVHTALHGRHTSRAFKLQQLLDELKNTKEIHTSYFQKVNDRLNQLIAPKLSDTSPNQLNVILNRKLNSGTLNSSYQNKIKDALFALDILCPNETVPGMEQFVKAFQKDFEGQSLNLLYALDPEIGIGYYVSAPEKENQLLETLHIAAKRIDDSTQNWTPAHSFLLEQWHRSPGERVPVMRLQENELAALKGKSEDLNITGLSVLFRIFNDQVYIESAGGVNAPALMGRFTVGDPEITAAARQMARQQEAANPDLIFAEILHLAGPHTDNVNRREAVWSYDLPVAAASALPDERQIALSDLKIRIENSKVLLYSEKHRKVVIPKLTSAYNHSIDKLPLFRFLADLSYQYGRYSLSLDLRQFFPGLSYYPRVEYKQTILHLATWILSEKQIKSLAQKEESLLIADFKDLVTELNLPPFFSLSDGDQQLIFFRDREPDILFFAGCLKQKKEAVLEEYLLESNDSAFVKDSDGGGLISQFNAYLLPQKPMVFAPFKLSVPAPEKLKRKFMPGSEWLYLKIYTSKIGSKRLLLNILPLIRRRYPGGPVQKWFFIRYDDHAPHIRLRMQIVPQDISEILIAFKNKLEDGVTQHVIREYQVDVYSRELERYQTAGIEPTENFFCASSELSVKFLKMKDKGNMIFVYQMALRTVRDMIYTFLPETDAQLQFAADSYQQFFPEFEEKMLRVEMDKKYRELARDIRELLSDADFYRSSGLTSVSRPFTKALNVLFHSVQTDENDKENFLRSIIHMHLNRIFTDDSRKQEMIVYYLLHKFLLSEKARSKSKGS
jgi:thiopeptide-type bacteriocin biosynthesis protein